jgi:hypothetical protein
MFSRKLLQHKMNAAPKLLALQMDFVKAITAITDI